MSQPILDVINGKKPAHVPVWLMRQAGRYLPAYQKLRQKYGFLTMCLTPELAAEATLQPVRFLDVDAAIIFSDILIPGLSLGLGIEFLEGKGPVISNPVRSPQDIRALRLAGGRKQTGRIQEAIKAVRASLPDEKSVVGFCAGPLTLAAYFIEGGNPGNFLKLKGLLYENPDAFHLLMEKITDTLIFFLKEQAQAGADLLQIFDTWGGVLAPSDFRCFSRPHLTRLAEEINKTCPQPLIYFMRGSAGFLPLLRELPVEVMGIDWTMDLFDAAQHLENRFVLQGNLDPAVLLAPHEIIKDRALEILNQGINLKGHIFNLGHGILPETPVENACYLVELVHHYNRR